MIWEIFANAEEPYAGMTNAQVKEKVGLDISLLTHYL